MKDSYPFTCARAGKSDVQFYGEMAETIKKWGRQIISIPGSKQALAFAYTIGNQEKNLPELLLLGSFHPHDQTNLLNALSEIMFKQKHDFSDGEEVMLPGGKLPLKVYNTTAVAKVQYTLQATEFYKNSDYKVQQVILCDPFGVFPPHPKCRRPFRVPILRPVPVLMKDATKKAN